jgi:hypothetical protein
MYLFRIFRSFLPLENPIGFGAADFIEFGLAALLVALILVRPRLEPAFRRLSRRTGWSMALAALFPVAARVALLGKSAVPIPGSADGLSFVLLADTLRHFRLANPTHTMHRFFEALFVLQEPAYASIYPAGQGIALALGRALFGHPWAGVLLSLAAFCGLCYWMLRGWTTPAWSLAGALLASIEFGPLNQWTNTYWGGGVSATAGCLVFGALPRLRRDARPRDAALLGLGLGLQLLTRPFEFLLLLAAVALYALTVRWPIRAAARPALFAALAFLPAAGLTVLQNHAVTGSWTTIPYQLSRYQYGVPTTFTTQSLPMPHRELTPIQMRTFEGQSAVHGDGTDTPRAWIERLGYRLRFYRFFFLAPLYLALPFFLPRLRERRFLWVAGVLAIFAVGTNFYPYFFQHYIAAATCLMVLAAVTALETLSRVKLRGWPAGREAALLLLFLCAAHFLFFYGTRLAGDEAAIRAVDRFESWDYINIGDAEGRRAVDGRIAAIPGKLLVFVRYGPEHQYQEWLHNEADIDAARVVWADDLGDTENGDLLDYYPDRAAWLLEPDARPPHLEPYRPQRIQVLPIH